MKLPLALAFEGALCHSAAMQPNTRRAGGCLLMGGILLGFAVGLLTGNAMRGVWLGTGVGIIAAVVVWLMDRRRD